MDSDAGDASSLFNLDRVQLHLASECWYNQLSLLQANTFCYREPTYYVARH